MRSHQNYKHVSQPHRCQRSARVKLKAEEVKLVDEKILNILFLSMRSPESREDKYGREEICKFYCNDKIF